MIHTGTCFMSRARCSAAALGLLASVVATSCGKDGDAPTQPRRIPSAIVAHSPAAFTATVGSFVSPPPSVRVDDAAGKPLPGVVVTFTVGANNGGSISGATATTDAQGIATVGSWNIGTQTGPSVLTATVSGLAPVTFTATAAAGPAYQVSYEDGDGQSATVGTAVIVAPRVVARDQYGNTIAGATVTFTLTSGGGTVTGTPAISNASGVATAGIWTLGTGAGANTLTASAGGGRTVTFTATGTAGPASRISILDGDGQSALAGDTLPTAPKVRVADRYGNAVGGVPVTFTITAGGGLVNLHRTPTGPNGATRVNLWALGEARGANVTNRLEANAGSIGSVVFTATAIDPCTASARYTLFTFASGYFTRFDCKLPDDRLVEFFGFATAGVQVVEFSQTSNVLDTHLLLIDASGLQVAANNDAAPGNPNSKVRVIMLDGAYTLEPTSNLPNATGPYTLSSAVASATVTNCSEVFVTPSQALTGGITTSQQITDTDCIGAGSAFDVFRIALKPGKAVTITMASSEFVERLEVYDPAGTLIAAADGTSSTDASVTFTPATTGFHNVRAGTGAAGARGAYSIRFP